jgi:hypothetical protein
MDNQEKSSERRKQRRLEQIGANNPVCVMCGCTKWYTQEGHHIAGRQFDKHVEYFCANCHRELSEKQKQHPRASCKSPGTGECAGHYCLGLADIFAPVSQMVDQFGHKLVDSSATAGLNTDVAKLMRDAGHFLIALAGILERVGMHLKEYGIDLTNEAQQAVAGV